MTKMQFGSYIFLQNPRRIELSRAQAVVSHLLPGVGMRAQGLGIQGRIVRCEGELFAPSAEGALTLLAGLFEACGEGAKELYLPTGERFNAFAGRVGSLAQGDGRVITYTVEFIEAETEG